MTQATVVQYTDFQFTERPDGRFGVHYWDFRGRAVFVVDVLFANAPDSPR